MIQHEQIQKHICDVKKSHYSSNVQITRQTSSPQNLINIFQPAYVKKILLLIQRN